MLTIHSIFPEKRTSPTTAESMKIRDQQRIHKKRKRGNCSCHWDSLHHECYYCWNLIFCFIKLCRVRRSIRSYRCEFCQKVFFRVLAYEKHRATHTGVAAAIKCNQPNCDFTYSDMMQLKVLKTWFKILLE
jgi:hypothetical protein